jgi:hypothetical protein
LDEAALIEHHPTTDIVRIDRPRRGRARDEIVMRVVHGRAGSMTMVP